MSDFYSSYYDKVKDDLLYESGTAENEGIADEEGEVSQLMYIRKTVNRVVNPVILNSYAVDIDAIEDEWKPVAEKLNKRIDGIMDSDKGRESYSVAFRNCVTSGIGYITIDTDYLDNKSMDQDVTVNKVLNPCTIMLDRLSSEVDGSDADKGCIIVWIDKNKAKALYGDGVAIEDWSTSMYNALPQPMENVVPEIIYYYKDSTSVNRTFLADGSYVDGEFESDGMVQVLGSRNVEMGVIKCCKYVGNEKVYETEFDMDFIPIVPVKGDITFVGDELKPETRGIVYLGKPANETANWYYQRELEMAKSAPLPPFMVDMDAMPEGENANIWRNMHKKIFNFLPFVGSDPNNPNNKYAPPMRVDTSPQFEPYMMARQKSQDDIRDITGLPDVNYGDDPSAQSGRSVFLRQKEGKMSTIHYQKNLERSIKQVCRIVIDLIGLVDGKKRIFSKENAETGEIMDIESSFMEMGIDHTMFEINLTQGPMSESTKQEGLSMLYEAAMNPQLAPVLDLLIEESGIPNSSAIAKRFQKMLPVELQDTEEDIPPQAKKVMDEMSATIDGYKQAGDQAQAKLQEAYDYIRLLQQEVNNKDKEVQAKLAVERMKQEGKLAETEMKIVGDRQQTIIEGQMKTDQEVIKQQAETERNAYEIQAEADKNMQNIQGEITKESIAAKSQVMQAELGRPKFNSVAPGPMTRPDPIQYPE